MPEKEIDVRPVSVSYICDKCGEGEMQHVVSDFGTIPAGYLSYSSFKHTCNKCGYVMHMQCIYPTIRYKEVGV